MWLRKSCKSCKVVIFENVVKECDILYGMYCVVCELLVNFLMICRKKNSESKICCNWFEIVLKYYVNIKSI